MVKSNTATVNNLGGYYERKNFRKKGYNIKSSRVSELIDDI